MIFDHLWCLMIPKMAQGCPKPIPKKRKNQIETKCTGPYCDESYWETHTKRELGELKSFLGHNTDTEPGNYLPNEFEGTCGRNSKTGHIYGGLKAKIGEFPFMAALGKPK